VLATPQGYTCYLPVGGQGGLELRWGDKAVADSIPYTFDCTAFLADAGNDAIVASTVTISASPDTLTIGPLQSSGTALTWQISGGVVTNPVADYAIDVAFTTVGGIVVNRNIWLRVWPLGPNKTFSTDLIVIQGPPGPAGAGLQGWSSVSAETKGYTFAAGDIGRLVQFTNNTAAIAEIVSGGALEAVAGDVIGIQLLGGAAVTFQPQTGVMVNGSNASITLQPGKPAEYRLTLNGDGASWELTGPPQYSNAPTFDTSGNLTITALIGANIVLENFMPAMLTAMGQYLLANANNPVSPASGEIVISGGVLEVTGA
jgi:hypothetical protein